MRLKSLFIVIVLVLAVLLTVSPAFAQDLVFTTNTPTPPGGEQTVSTDVSEVPVTIEPTLVISDPDPLPEDTPPATEPGIPSNLVFAILCLFVVSIVTTQLPNTLALWRSSPHLFKQTSYPLIDAGLAQGSQVIADKIHLFRTDTDPTNDNLVPNLLADLKKNEDARRQFADAARLAGLQVDFAEITPPGG